jgi:hypothetical protein
VQAPKASPRSVIVKGFHIHVSLIFCGIETGHDVLKQEKSKDHDAQLWNRTLFDARF